MENEPNNQTTKLFDQARQALGTEAEAREFLASPHPLLDGLTPAQAAQTDQGANRVAQILHSLEFGLAL